MVKDDSHFMTLAIAEAKNGEGKTFPNPIVGCVIVEDDEIVARGHHAKAGGAHAEINALSQLGRAPKDNARMYVTLEPCSTLGKTGACTKALITSGIKKIYVGTIDPNPIHKGKGINILKEAGMEVNVGILEKQCRELNEDFNRRMKEKEDGERK